MAPKCPLQGVGALKFHPMIHPPTPRTGQAAAPSVSPKKRASSPSPPSPAPHTSWRECSPMPIQGLCHSLTQTPQGPPGPPSKSLKGCSQKVRRQAIRCFPFIISSCRGGVFVKLKANFSPSHSKPNYCPQNSSRKQKDKIALPSYLAFSCLSDACFICTSCPVPPSLSSPQGLQDQKTAGSKCTPNSFHFLFPELPKRSKKLGLHFCVCERVCMHAHRCPHMVHRGRVYNAFPACDSMSAFNRVAIYNICQTCI